MALTFRGVNAARLLAVAILGLLAACGGAAPVGSGGAAVPSVAAPPAAGGLGGNASGPCSLITEAEIESILGGKDVAVPDVDTKGCTFNAIDLSADLIAINVRVEDPTGVDFSSIRLLFADGKDVSGIGDAAFSSEDSSLLYFARNNRMYAVQIVFLPDELDQTTVSQAIARKMLEHIG